LISSINKSLRSRGRGISFARSSSFIWKIAGVAGGILGFYTSKALACIVNLRKKAHKISPETAERLKLLFPEMPLGKIRIICNAWLPAHLFNRSIEGMTFHNRIYVTHPEIEHNYAGFMLLLHELVHVRQIGESGEFIFACKYGEQFLINGGYSEKMPFENEAYEFVDKNRYRITELC
jgi:hypothetical protein